jgi:hypothetical protein
MQRSTAPSTAVETGSLAVDASVVATFAISGSGLSRTGRLAEVFLYTDELAIAKSYRSELEETCL